MVPREKITPPRIVEPNPLVTAFWLLAFLFSIGAAVAFGFELGRSTLAPDCSAYTEQIDYLKERITSLQEDPERLLEPPSTPAPSHPEGTAPINQAEQPAEPSAIKEIKPTSEQSVSALNVAPRSARPLPMPPPEPEQLNAESKPPADSSARKPVVPAENKLGQLAIKNFTLKPAGADNQFVYQFSVSHAGERSGMVSGSIWIAVNGMLGNTPKRIPLRQISNKEASFIRMRFKQLQLVEGKLLLPDGFSPTNMIVEAKPIDEQYAAASATFSWNTN